MIGVPTASRCSLARRILSRLAFPVPTTRTTASTMRAKRSASFAAKIGGESKNTMPNACEIDLNAVRALDQSTAPRNRGDFRPLAMKLTTPACGDSVNAVMGWIASAASASPRSISMSPALSPLPTAGQRRPPQIAVDHSLTRE